MVRRHTAKQKLSTWTSGWLRPDVNRQPHLATFGRSGHHRYRQENLINIWQNIWNLALTGHLNDGHSNYKKRGMKMTPIWYDGYLAKTNTTNLVKRPYVSQLSCHLPSYHEAIPLPFLLPATGKTRSMDTGDMQKRFGHLQHLLIWCYKDCISFWGCWVKLPKNWCRNIKNAYFNSS